jgi:N-acetylglucosamine malate deacetylase 2
VTEFATLCPPGEQALVVIAHPDDETFCAGLIAGLCHAGTRVAIACVTRGEGGETGDLTGRADLGMVREAELRASAALLGVDDVRLLGLVDPIPVDGFGQAPAVSPEVLAHLVATTLDELRPRLVVTHGSRGEYGHAAHVAVHRAVLAACSGQADRPTVLTMLAELADHPLSEFMNEGDVCNVQVDVRATLAQRLRSLQAHRTQVSVLRPLEEAITRLSIESYCRVG